MKIINETGYKTAHLRAFVTKLAKIEFDHLPPYKRKRVVIRFVHARNDEWCSGLAWPSELRALVRIPKPGSDVDLDHLQLEFARVLRHELAHVRGLPGGRAGELSMRVSIPYGRPTSDEARAAQEELYRWCFSLPLEAAEEKPAVRPGDADKLAATEEKLRQWTAKAKRAATALKKYRKRHAYYLKKLGTAAMK